MTKTTLDRQIDLAERAMASLNPMLSGHPNVEADQRAMATLVAGVLIAGQLSNLAESIGSEDIVASLRALTERT